MKSLLSFRWLPPTFLLTTALASSQGLLDYYTVSAQMSDSFVQVSADSLPTPVRSFSINQGTWPNGFIADQNYPTSVTFSLPGGDSLTMPIVPSDLVNLVSTTVSTSSYTAVTSLFLPLGGTASLNYQINPSSRAPITLSSTLHGGTLDSLTYTATGDPAHMPDPFSFSAGTFNLFTNSGILGAGTVPITFSSVSVPDGVTNAIAYFVVSQYVSATDAQGIFYAGLNAGDTSTLFDTGLLQPGQSYLMYVYEQYTATDGVIYQTSTATNFSTVPESSSTVAFLGGMAFTVAALRRRFR